MLKFPDQIQLRSVFPRTLHIVEQVNAWPDVRQIHQPNSSATSMSDSMLVGSDGGYTMTLKHLVATAMLGMFLHEKWSFHSARGRFNTCVMQYHGLILKTALTELVGAANDTAFCLLKIL
jgi:hypothetical protein